MSKIKIEIKNKWTDSVLFEYEKENNTLKDTIEQAIKENANLAGANLEGANLAGVYIFVDDSEINEKDIIEKFEQNTNIKIKETHINKNIFPTRWNAFWKYGLIICDWEIEDKEDNKDNKDNDKEIETLNPDEAYLKMKQN